MNFRHALVTLQFALSLLLVIGAIVIYQQVTYMKQQSLGFDKMHVLVLPYKWDGKVLKQYEFLKQEFLREPGIESVTQSGDIPGKMSTTMSCFVEGMPEEKTETIQTLYVDYDFVATYGLQISRGRDFSKEITADQNGGAYILNERAVAAFGWKIKDAIGKRMSVQADGKVIGVVKDFHFNSLQEEVTPLVISIRPDRSGYISLRVSTTGIDKTLAYIENVWKKNLPDRPLVHFFLEESFNNLYLAEDRISKLVTIFTALAFLISGIGIVGLTIFAIKKRTKELGIRKLLGASFGNIAVLFSKEFLTPVLISMLIAFPLGFYLMHSWLQNFAYRIGISWWVFLVSGLTALLLSIVIAGFQSVKAALANPVKSLRTE